MTRRPRSRRSRCVADVEPTLVFVAAGIAVAGLAYVLGDATRRPARPAGTQIAALLNATFGNLPELVIVILTLRGAGERGAERLDRGLGARQHAADPGGSSLLFGGLRHGHARSTAGGPA